VQRHVGWLSDGLLHSRQQHPVPPGATKCLERHELECTSNNSRKIGVSDGFSENCFELGTAAPFDEAFDAILDTDRASEFVELLP
jgi:hypothetical protein